MPAEAGWEQLENKSAMAMAFMADLQAANFLGTFSGCLESCSQQASAGPEASSHRGETQPSSLVVKVKG